MNSDFSFEPYALVVRRDDPDFRLAVNSALVATFKSGDIDAVYVKWLAPPRVINLSYEPLFQEGDQVRVSGDQLELVNP